MHQLSARKKLDLAVVLCFIAVSATVSVLLRTDVMISVFLYLGLPSLYLCLREAKNYRKIILSSLIMGVLLGMSYNLIAEMSRAYATYHFLPVFDIVLLGVTPLGDFIWGFLIIFSMLTFYEHFFDDEKHSRMSKHWVFALGVGWASFYIVAWMLLDAPEVLGTQYAFLILGLVSVAPLILLLWTGPRLLHKVFWLSAYFLILNLAFELSAVHLGQWSFPGTYVSLLTFATVSFPLEEFLFWIVFGTPSLILCYEFLLDDGE